jgi:hypothetical protein
MIEKSIPLKLKPGVYRNGTRYEAKNRWYAANCVRWTEGIMGPIGGWRKVQALPMAGTATAGGASTLTDAAQTWRTNQFAGRTLYILAGTGAGQTRIIASNTATVLTVTVAWTTNPDNTSQYQISPSGVVSSASALTLTDSTQAWATNQFAGLLVEILNGKGVAQVRTIASNTATTLTITSQWSTVPDTTSTYQIAPAYVTATGKPRAAYGWRDNGGVSHMAVGTHSKLYVYTDGELFDATPTTGFPSGGSLDAHVDGLFVGGNYGSGAFGSGYYGTGSGALTLVAPSTWTLDNFGQILVACHTLDGRLLKYDPSVGSPAAVVDPTAPTGNTGVVVTPEHFIVALGANNDARLVKWPDQQSLIDWAITDTNQANEFPLPTKGRLVTGRRTRRQTLLWTDVDVFAMTFVGGADIYAFEQLGDNCGIVGPQACVVLGDRSFWMSYGKFFEYDGALKPIECDVLNEVFDNLDQSQRAKVQAIPMTLFNEVWWTYPSKGRSTYENDKYVGYNYIENHWILGDVPRAAGIDRGVYEYPILLDPDGYLYEHEFGALRTGAKVFAETGPIEIGDGDNAMRIQQIIPDEKTLGDVSMTLFGAFDPTSVEKSKGPFTATQPTPVRMTAKQVRLRVDEVTPTDWRVGVPKLGVLPAGTR